jgi:hypothetical protein
MELTPANNWFLFNFSAICSSLLRYSGCCIQNFLRAAWRCGCTAPTAALTSTWSRAWPGQQPPMPKFYILGFKLGLKMVGDRNVFFWWFSSKVQDWAKHFAKWLCGWNQHELVFTAFHSSPLACWQEAKNSENTAKLHLVVPERKHVAHSWTIDSVACWHILSTARWCNPRCICRPYWTLYDCRAITAASQGQGWQHKVGSQRIHSLDLDCF